MRKQLGIVFNILASLIACFFFGYYATNWYGASMAMRVLWGVVCSALAALAEVYFVMRTSMLLEQRETKRRDIRMGKRVLTTTTASGGGSKTKPRYGRKKIADAAHAVSDLDKKQA